MGGASFASAPRDHPLVYKTDLSKARQGKRRVLFDDYTVTHTALRITKHKEIAEFYSPYFTFL